MDCCGGTQRTRRRTATTFKVQGQHRRQTVDWACEGHLIRKLSAGFHKPTLKWTWRPRAMSEDYESGTFRRPRTEPEWRSNGPESVRALAGPDLSCR